MTTWYVIRDANGKITTACAYPQDNVAAEAVADTDAELQAFLAPPVPTITPLQALLWLAKKGKQESDVQSLINSITDTTQRLQAQAYWDKSPVFHHDNAFIVNLWAGLGIAETTQQAFAEAATL